MTPEDRQRLQEQLDHSTAVLGALERWDEIGPKIFGAADRDAARQLLAVEYGFAPLMAEALLDVPVYRTTVGYRSMLRQQISLMREQLRPESLGQ